MKAIVIALLATSVLSPAAEKEKVRVEVFDESTVLIGKLGKPFGTVVRVTCRGMAQPKGDAGRTKEAWWEETVEITAIEGKRLEAPILIKWSNFMTGTVEKPAAGVSTEVWGYESGRFEGTPPEAFRHVPSIADVGFHFASHFVALKKVEPAREAK